MSTCSKRSPSSRFPKPDLCQFLFSMRATCPIHLAKISSSAVYSGTRWICVLILNARDQVLHPLKESGTIKILYILFCMFLDIRREHETLWTEFWQEFSLFNALFIYSNRVLVGKPEGRRPLGRTRRRWEDNIEMDLQELGWVVMDWKVEDRDMRPVFVNAVMNLRVP